MSKLILAAMVVGGVTLYPRIDPDWMACPGPDNILMEYKVGFITVDTYCRHAKTRERSEINMELLGLYVKLRGWDE